MLHLSMVFYAEALRLKNIWLLPMHTKDFYGNVLFIYANRFPSKQKISGTQHNFKRMCGTSSFAEHVESYNFGSTGGSVVAGTKKICTSETRKPFFGTDTRWEPVINIFHWTRHLLIHQNPFRIDILAFMLSSCGMIGLS